MNTLLLLICLAVSLDLAALCWLLGERVARIRALWKVPGREFRVSQPALKNQRVRQ